MGIWSWIKDTITSGPIERTGLTKTEKSKERAYWWVSEAQRKKCRKILDDNWRNANRLTLGWPAWHKCMQQESKPISEYRIVRDIRWLVNFIKELVGIKEEKIVVKDIPPTFLKLKPTAPRPAPKEKIPKEKKKKEPKRITITRRAKGFWDKPKKPKKPRKRKLADRSHLSFNLFSGALNWRNLIKPDFLLKFENLDEKILEEISMMTGEKNNGIRS